MQEVVLDLKGVTVRRNEHYLLRDLSWRTHKGEQWALIGANGSGKTTLLQTILGYLWPTKGQITVLGRKLGSYDVRELRKEIGFVSVNMDVRIESGDSARNIVLSGKTASYGLYEDVSEKDVERAIELLGEMGATAISDERYGTLSQGEKQKVLIARALMANPSLLVLDEPCNGLDFPSRERLLDAISRICQSAGGPQVVLVTHYPDEIVSAVTHVMVLREGMLVAAGEKRDVLKEDVLASAYGVPVSVDWHNDFPVVRMRRS